MHHLLRPGELLRPRATALLDVVTLGAFVAIGRASHHHGDTAAGFVSTFWPFGVGLIAGWAARALIAAAAGSEDRAATSLSFERPRAGLLVAAVTVSVGMVLRVVAGQGTAFSFIVVALVFNGLIMAGGRAAAALVTRRWSPPADAAVVPHPPSGVVSGPRP